MPAPRPTRHRPPVPVDAAGLFTRADAIAAGWTDSSLTAAIRGGRLQRLRPGVFTAVQSESYASPEAARDDLLRRAGASLRTTSDAVISHASAAVVHDLPRVGRMDRPCLTVQSGKAIRTIAAAHLHRATLLDHDVVAVDGLRCTSVVRTVLDIAREHGVDAGLAAVDAALHRRLLTPDRLTAALPRYRNWPGATAARNAVALSDGRAESPLESISRLRMHECGLPAPQLQVNLGDEQGRFIRRVDFYLPEYGIAGEADGNMKYEQRAALRAEKWQQEQLEDLGVVFVRWGWRDTYQFDSVAARFRKAMARGIGRGHGQRWSILPHRT